MSLFKNDWAGTHNFKVGFELYRDTQERDQTGYPGIPARVQQRLATAVRQYQPSFAINRLFAGGVYVTDTWTLGCADDAQPGRADRSLSIVSAGPVPAGQPVRRPPQHFAAVDNVITWNLPAPRFGATYKIDGDGKTVVKANAGRYWWNPDVNVASSVNANIATAYERYAWTDPNRDRSYQAAEQGRLLSRVGGAGLALDPNLKDTYTDELAGWLDHELLPTSPCERAWSGVVKATCGRR